MLCRCLYEKTKKVELLHVKELILYIENDCSIAKGDKELHDLTSCIQEKSLTLFFVFGLFFFFFFFHVASPFLAFIGVPYCDIYVKM